MYSLLLTILALFFGALIFQIILNILFIPLRIYGSRHQHQEPQVNEDFIPLIESIPTEYISYDEYTTYLLSDEWKTKRTERLLTDKYICQYCNSVLIEPEVHGATSALELEDSNIPNVHHLNYNHLKHENIEHDLVSLCKKCHLELHATYDLPTMEYHINLHRGITTN